jgi:hypothetical protein
MAICEKCQAEVEKTYPIAELNDDDEEIGRKNYCINCCFPSSN